MATRRIKEITNTATTFASDDFIALDGTSQGTRKMDKDDLISQVSAGVSGDYLEEANNLSDVASVDTSKLNLEVPDVGTAPNEVPMSGQLGTMAFQDSAGVSVGQLEVTEKAGIGTSNPSTRCHIVGDNGDQLKLDNDGDQWTQVNFANNNSTKTFVALDHTNHKFIVGANGSYSDLNYIGIRPDGTNDDLVVTRDGLVGIGTTSPGSYDADADDLVVGNSSTPTNSGATIATVGGGVGSLYFADGTTAPARYAGYLVYNHGSNSLIFGSNATTQWTINSSGNLVGSGGGQILYNDGDVLFPGASANLNWDKSASNLILGTGAGIDFGSGASTTLDSYEEGTFTPTTGGTWTSAPTSLSGSYVKVGDLVYAVITFGASSSKSSSTSGYLDGLPFNVNGSSVGSVSDVGVRDLGNCLAANVTRVWLTETSFPATATASVVYRTS